MPKFKDISNTENEYFKILNVSHTTKYNGQTLYYYNCLCKKCSGPTIIKKAYLCNGHTKSCGCTMRRQGHNSPFFKGYGELPRSYYGQIIRSAKGGGKFNKSSKEFNVSMKYLWELFLAQNRKCALSGMELSFEGSAEENSNRDTSRRTASLDRIDSSKGYIEGNVQWVHKKINIMKNEYTSQDFIDMCKQIVEFNSKSKLQKL